MVDSSWGRDCGGMGSELLFFFLILVILFCSCGSGRGFGKY